MQYDEYTEGWTTPIEHTLVQDGEIFNATGMTPALVLKDKDGSTVAIKGTVQWADATISRIRFSPDADDFKAAKSPYRLHWKVTDLSNKIAYYPQGAPILITVYLP